MYRLIRQQDPSSIVYSKSSFSIGVRRRSCSRSVDSKEHMMEFLVEFEVNVPDGTPVAEVKDRENAEASAAAKLVDEGHLVRLWNRPIAPGDTRIVGLYRADSETELDGLLEALPLSEWMQVTVTPLEPHPNDPGVAQVTRP
jgi:muconolactone D-isomerase